MLNIKELVIATKGKLINGDENFIPRKYVIDSRNVDEKSFFIPIIGESTDGHKYIVDAVNNGIYGFFINKDYVGKETVINSSININKDICIIEVDDTKEALYKAGEYNRNKHIDIPVVAVTGSVGKTSTREMIASVLRTEKNVLTTKANYNSLIGAPIMALEMENQDICVFEIGTDSFGEIEKLSNLVKPNIGVITVIGTAHIGIFKSREGIFNEKIQITSHMIKPAILIVNGNDDYLVNVNPNDKYDVIKYYSEDAKNVVQNTDNIEFEASIYDKLNTLTINQIGVHNVKNAICAIKVGECLEISTSSIIKGISNYQNFSRRLEKISLKDNITLIDDTYNASIDSMKSGLKTVNELKAKRKIAVLGDMLELGDFSAKLHSEIGKVINTLNYDIIYLFGKEAKNIATTINKDIKINIYDDMDKLINDLNLEIKEGDIVYLKASNGMKFNRIIEFLKSR